MTDTLQDINRTLREQLNALTSAASTGAFRVQLDDSGRLSELSGPGTWLVCAPSLVGLPPDSHVDFAALMPNAHADMTLAVENINQYIASGATETLVRVASRLDANGEPVWTESRIQIIRDASGKATHLEGILRDITQERQSKADVRELGEFLRKILLQVPVAILRMEISESRQQVFSYANLSGNWIINASPLYGLPEGSIVAPWECHDYVHPDDQQSVKDSFARAVAHSLPRYAVEYRTIWPDGSVHWIDNRMILERNPMGDIIAIDGIQYDITDRKLQQQRIEYMAGHDVLTDLPNRALCMDTLERVIAAGRRYRREFAVMYLDLDHFKEVNDQFGHDVGDKLLVEVSKRFKKALRSSEFVARIGGDEFLVIAEQLTIPEDIDLVARRLVAAAAEPLEINGHRCQVSVSIGVSIFPHHSDEGELLMKYADTALYQAKGAGRNDYRLYRPVD